MDFTKLKKDNQPIPLLENLIAWHGIDKVLTAYDAWLCNEDEAYYEAHGVSVETAEELAKEVADVIDVDREYYINDEPAIETELVKFLERWYPKSKTPSDAEQQEISLLYDKYYKCEEAEKLLQSTEKALIMAAESVSRFTEAERLHEEIEKTRTRIRELKNYAANYRQNFGKDISNLKK